MVVAVVVTAFVRVVVVQVYGVLELSVRMCGEDGGESSADGGVGGGVGG